MNNSNRLCSLCASKQAFMLCLVLPHNNDCNIVNVSQSKYLHAIIVNSFVLRILLFRMTNMIV